MKIKHLLFAMAISLAAFASCNKDKESQPTNNDNGGKKAIATMSNGQMNYLVSVEEMQAKVDANTANTKSEDNFIIEDWHIENGDGTARNPLALVVSVVNVETEEVTTHYFMNECLITEQRNGVTTYYINPALLDGEYELFTYSKESADSGKASALKVKNGEITNSHEEPAVNQPGHPYWHVDCTAQYCQKTCQRQAYAGPDGSYTYGCELCQMPAPGHGGGEGEANDAACNPTEVGWWERILGWFTLGGFSIF